MLKRAILVGGGKLNDKYINMLKVHDPRIEGLWNILQQAQFNFNTSSVVQIVHVQMDHWIVISNIFSSTKG